MSSSPIRSLLETTDTPTIGVFGHFGNLNLGDEATIAAVIQNIRARIRDVRIVGFSSNPLDTATRYNVTAYPIRKARWRPRAAPARSDDVRNRTSSGMGTSLTSDAKRRDGWIRSLAARVPWAKAALRVLGRVVRCGPNLAREVVFLYQSYRVLRNESLDVLMVTGSNQFLDNFGGPWGFPYTLLKWSVLGRLAGSKIIFVCVGAGPVEARLSRMMIRRALGFSSYTSFRDEASRALVEEFGFRGSSDVLPDLAFSLDAGLTAPRPERGAALRIGINPMPVYDKRYWYVHDDKKYRAYTEKLASLATLLSDQGHSVVFWGTQPKDANVIDDVTGLLDAGAVSVRHTSYTPQSVCELMRIISSCDVVVATRFHGVVLSLLAGVGVVAVCYHRKQDDLMKDTGHGDFSSMLETLDVTETVERLRALEAGLPALRRTTRAAVDRYRSALERQYDHLFGQSGRRSVVVAQPVPRGPRRP